MPTATSQEIADLVSGRLLGPGDKQISGVAALDEATDTDLSFLGNARYRDQVLPSRAAVVILPEDFAEEPPKGRAWILCPDPSAAFSKVVDHFAPAPITYPPGRHPQSAIDPTAVVADSAHIGPFAVIEAGAVIGPRTVIGAGVYVGAETHIGQDCLIYPNVTIRERCLLADRIIIHSGTTIGSDGFGFIPGKDGHTKIPQVGIVQIDDDVEIGAQVGIDRARFGRTWIKRGAKIDNLVMIAHNVVVGEMDFIVGQAGVAGSTQLGKGVIVAGQVGIAGHLHIGDGAVLMAQAGVTKDVPSGATVVGFPAAEHRQFARSQASINQIPALKKSLRELQQEVERLKGLLEGKE